MPHMHWSCGCGYVVHADDEETLVRKAQEHARQAHGQEATREAILKAAEAASH